MALTDVQDILTDANFQNLPDEEKIKVLSREDPDFKGLPEPEKAKVVGGLQGILKQLPAAFTLPGQQAGSLLTGSSRGSGVSDPFSSLPPEEKQRQIELEVFGKQFPKTAMTADLGRFILESGGGMVGALPGVATGPFAPVVSTAAGGLGFAGGKQLADILDMGLGTPRGRELTGRTPVEGVTELGKDVATGVALEGLIKGASPVLRRGFQGIANVPGRVLRAGASEQSQMIADQLAARGVQVTPGMASQAPLMRGTEAALESFPFSGARLAREFETIERQFAEAQEQSLSRFGPKEGDIAFGDKVKTMLQKGDEISRKTVEDAYNAPEALVGDTVKYQTKESANAARQLLKQEKQLPGRLAEEVTLLKQLSGVELASLKQRAGSTSANIKEKISQVIRKEVPEDAIPPESFKADKIEEIIQRDAPNVSDDQKKVMRSSLSQLTPAQLGYKPTPPSQLSLADLSNDQFENLSESSQDEIIKLLGGPKPSSLNWPTLVRARARVNNLIEAAESSPGGKEEAKVLRDLASGIRKDLRGFAEQVGPDVSKALDAADSAHVARQAIFGDERMMKLLQAEPEAFKRLIARNESASLVSKLKEVTGPQGFAPIKRAFAEKIFSAPKPLEEFGDDTLKSVFDATELADLKTFTKQAEFLNLRRPDQSLSTTKRDVRRVISLSPFGVSMVAGPAAGVGAAALTTIPPAMVAKLWLSPSGRRYLMEGANIDANSRAGRVIAGSIRSLVAGGSAIESVQEEPSLTDVILQNRERIGP